MWAVRQARHQQLASAAAVLVVPLGTGTAGGSSVHQQGAASPAAMAQCNSAPQRPQRCSPAGEEVVADMAIQASRTARKKQPVPPYNAPVRTPPAVQFRLFSFRTRHDHSEQTVS